MKQFMLATVASLALSLPAVAAQNMQQNNTPTQPTQQQQTQMNNQGQSGQNAQQNQRQAENVIRPSQLSKKQIRQVQESLNKKGFDASHADGIWGPETARALRTFEQQNHLQGHGHLTQQSLAQLGVNMNTNAQQGSETTGSSSQSDASQPSQNPGMTNPGQQNDQTNGQGTSSNQNAGSQQMNQTPGQNSGSTSGNNSQSSGPTYNK